MAEESIIGKFFGLLGFKVETEGIDAFQAHLGHLTHAVEVAFGYEAIKMVGEFVERSIGGAASIQKLSEVVGVGADHIAAMDRVAVDNSSSVEAMNEAIRGVSRATGQAAIGLGRGGAMFKAIGLHAKDARGHVKDVDTVMGELADKFRGMDDAKRNAIAGRLGIDPLLAKAMGQAGSEGWRNQIKASLGGGILTAKDYAQAEKMEKTFTRFHLLLGQLTTLVAVQLAPWLRKGIDLITQWVSANKAEALRKFNEKAKVLGEILQRIWMYGSKVVGGLFSVYKIASNSIPVMGALGVALALIAGASVYEGVNKLADAFDHLFKGGASSLLSWPAIIGAIVLGIALIAEDWAGFQAGEESVLGDLKDSWPKVFNAINTAMTEMLGIWNDVVAAARALGVIEKPKDKREEVGSARELYERQQTADMIARGELTPEQGRRMIEMHRYTAGSMGQTNAELAAETQSGPWAPAEATAGPWLNQGTNRSAALTYISGTTVNVIADTPERAKTAGKSVREAMTGPERNRNYQSRGE